MNKHLNMIKENIASAQAVEPIANNAVLASHCLYDGGVQVNVYFFPEEKGLFTVSDNGHGYTYLAELNCLPQAQGLANGSAIEAAKRYSVVFDPKDYAFKIRAVSAENLFAASLFVSNASQYWVKRIITKHKRHGHENLNAAIYETTLHFFDTHAGKQSNKYQVTKNLELSGESSKIHKIHTAITIKGQRILLEGVSNDAASVNATFVKYHDIAQHTRSSGDKYQKLAIVGSKKNFKAENINLLRAVSDLVIDSKDQEAYLKTCL